MKHNFLRRAGAMLLALTLVLSTAVTTALAADGPVAVTSITLDKTSLELNPNETATLTATVWPADADNKAVTWKSNKPEIAHVSVNGQVTAYQPGSTTITVRSEQTASVLAICQVTVKDPTVPSITLSQSSVPLMVGDTYSLKADVSPSSLKVTWRSDNDRQVSVDDNGNLAALAVATSPVTIRATVRDAQNRTAEATCTVTVRDPGSLNATSLTAKGSTTLTLSAGQLMTLDVNAVPSTAYVTWTSDKPGVVSVTPTDGSAAQVRAVGAGEATVTAMASRQGGGDPLTVEYKISVSSAAGSIEFNDVGPVRFDLESGRTRVVSVRVTPSGTNTYVNWVSSSPSIASVTANQGASSATLTIPGSHIAGRATITATVYDRTSNQPVTVTDENGKEVPLSDDLEVIVSGFTLSETNVTMYEGQAKPLSVRDSYGAAEGISSGGVRWTSSDPGVATMESGSINAWAKGTAILTATSIADGYTAACTVNVVEDEGTIVNAGTAAAGGSVKLGTSSIISQINRIANERTGANMDYITGIFISPDHGVVYNTYISESDTGAGVSMGERYYVNRTTPASECISALSFVPNKTYSGEARITYIGRANGQDVTGVISINVSGMGDNGSDVAYTANAAPVTFQADDFNLICANKTGRSLKYVIFTLPQASAGTLYENYTSAGHPGQPVQATTQYSRTGSPSLSSVTFVPADGYSGTVTITYKAVDAANATYNGNVTITVIPAVATTDPADIYYTAPKGGRVTFRPSDFAGAGLRTTGETLSHVRFSLPASSDGTLFYNYRGSGDYDGVVASTTNYYYQTNNPALSGVTFVPATTSSGKSVISYTGYSTRGTTFTGKIFVTEGTGTGTSQPGVNVSGNYNYTVSSGSAVSLGANLFNNASLAATGASLNYVQFTSLPTDSQGSLHYRTYGSTYYSSVSTYIPYYRSGTPSLSSVFFQASPSYTGEVYIPYIGCSTNNISFAGEIVIQVTPNSIVYTVSGTTPIRLSASRIRTAIGSSFYQALSYIEFTDLPSSSAGQLYSSYSTYGTGIQVNTGVRYYAASLPSIDQLTFIPTGQYTGDASACYTAYSASGEQMSGMITFRSADYGTTGTTGASGTTGTAGSTASEFFTDMSNYTWAVTAVDYLYRNGVTKGVTSTTFGPNQQIPRRDFVLMLCRAFRISGGDAAKPGFDDVFANSYYAQALSAAKEKGIISGDGKNFMPNSPITRQDAMVMVKNAMAATGRYTGTASVAVLNRFSDASSVSAYARDAVSTLVQLGIVTGSSGLLNPRASISRAEAAVLLYAVMTR